MTTDELIIDEELTPDMLIDIGREWQEFLLKNMTTEELLARVSKQDILHLLDQDESMRKDVVAHLPAEEILQVLDQDEAMRKDVVAHLPPEERLIGLKPEDLPALMEQIERYLRQQPNKPEADNKA